MIPVLRFAIQKLMRHLLIVAGSVFLALGIIGIFIPLLPTTPFLLLSAACFARSSPRLHAWLMSGRWVGEHIRRYREGLGVPAGVKIWSVGLLWVVIGFSALMAVQSTAVRIILFVIAVGVTVHIVTRPTFRK